MRFGVLATGALAILSAPVSAQDLSWQGIGPVQLGMTIAQAERALSGKLKPRDLPFSEQCYVTQRADGKDEALSYVVVAGKIVVMTVFLANEKQPDPNIVDKDGVGVGSTEADIIRAYGPVKKELAPDFRDSAESLAEAAKERASHGITEPENPTQFWIEVESPDHKRVMIFETREQKVLNLEIGFKPEIMSSEHCI